MYLHIVTFMAYIGNELGNDFQQGGSLYQQTSDIQWTLEYVLM